MIDADVMRDRIREANPIPHVENLDADELAYFVATTRARRAAAMQAPTQHPSETATPPAAPPPRRRSVWAFAAAFVLVLVVVGGAALLLLADDVAPPADEPVPTTTLETPTTLAEAPPPTVGFDDTGIWRATRLAEPWARSIADVASLPSGGFVVVTTDDRLVWSPDGVEWIDADPQRQVTVATQDFWEFPNATIDVIGDQVVVLAGDEPGLWIGDTQTGSWKSILFETGDLVGEVEPVAVACSDTQVLVLAEYRPEPTKRGYLVWLLDPSTSEVERHPLSVTGVAQGARAVEWVSNRWVVALAYTVLVSPNGATWTHAPGEDSFHSLEWVTSFAAGSPGVVAVTEAGLAHGVWFSEDGRNWVSTAIDGRNWDRTAIQAAHGAESLYSDAFGFLVPLDQRVAVSPDGRNWYAIDTDLDPESDLAGFQNLAVSGHTALFAKKDGAVLLTYERKE